MHVENNSHVGKWIKVIKISRLIYVNILLYTYNHTLAITHHTANTHTQTATYTHTYTELSPEDPSGRARVALTFMLI